MRLIDADEAKKKIRPLSPEDETNGCTFDTVKKLMHKLLDEASTVDAQPVVIGKWLWDENGMDWGLGAWRCSVCGNKPETGWEADQKYIPRRCSGSKFCGNCGAKME